MTSNVVVVTGAASGIGAATARKCLETGCRVVGIDVAWPLPASADGPDAAVQREVADVRDLASLTEIADRLRESGLSVSGLVCSAGVAGRVLMERVVEADARRVIEINLLGVILTMRAFVPLMIERGEGGAVVNIASAAAVRARDTLGVYGASKAGVVQATRVAAIEWARYGIRVNAVLPGPIDTPMTRDSTRALLDMHAAGVASQELSTRGIDEVGDLGLERVTRSAAKQVPLGRLGKPDEVADAVMFLLGPRAAYITGEGLSVSGGSILGYRAD